MSASAVPLVATRGRRNHRLIPSRFPPIALFDAALSPEEATAAFALEAATNERLAEVRGRLAALPAAERAAGPGAGYAMAAFLHGAAGRFNDGRLGAWYAALERETAIDEVAFHLRRRLAASAAGFPAVMDLRELVSRPRARLRDLARLPPRQAAPLLRPDDYARSQIYGLTARTAGADGLLWPSVRRCGGTCLVLFKPRLCLPVAQGDHYRFAWDSAGAFQAHRLTAV